MEGGESLIFAMILVGYFLKFCKSVEADVKWTEWHLVNLFLQAKPEEGLLLCVGRTLPQGRRSVQIRRNFHGTVVPLFIQGS